AAVNHKGSPTVILAKTVKGYGMGDAGESENTTHQVKKVGIDDLKQFRERFDLPIPDRTLSLVPYYQPPLGSKEMSYIRQVRKRLGGYIPRRVEAKPGFDIPGLEMFQRQLEGTAKRETSTTSVFVNLLQTLCRNKELRDYVVPIIPDEARTFGMEGMFKQLGIYSSEGQLYTPEDEGGLSAYRESKDGQVLEEGINEAGAFSAWLAAATSYSSHRFTLIPFYIFYSMFGFQRVGDLAWAAGDMQARGFLLGATAGRTTLNGEGLQHQDGHSHLLSSAIPNCVSYDPCFAYELAVIIHRGLQRMYVDDERVFYYITLMNERYTHPPMPEGVEDQILQGMYKFQTFGNATRTSGRVVHLLGSGTIFREVLKAAEMLSENYDVTSHVWSVTSFSELAREGADTDRWNTLHPDEPARISYVGSHLSGTQPVIAATDYLKVHAGSIQGYIDAPYRVLGTDGFGRSDTRENLRRHFEVDSKHIAVSALKSLADAQVLPYTLVKDAIEEMRIDQDKPEPRSL
ncbi:MAG: pyruvate dehydrogenase (acetyl-transferring), homodimeric type, partial [Gammaproteobacteria bacterium]|nr:pyruvate dehydrogenase (acetyl-transferring), homodimeric type [Gammaproteobacteria bacterium]